MSHAEPHRWRRALRMALAALLLNIAGACVCSPETALERSFGVELPANVRVEHFDELFLASAEVWVMTPVDDAFLQGLVADARLTRHQPGDDAMPGLCCDWPAWWRADSIEALPELYWRADSTGDLRVWVDRRANRLYLQSFAN